MLELVDELIDSSTHFAARLAKHRKSNTLEVRDLQLHLGKLLLPLLPLFRLTFSSSFIDSRDADLCFPSLPERNHGIRVPGLGTDGGGSSSSTKRPAVASTHAQRIAAVNLARSQQLKRSK
jgi:transcription initiation factor TFIID subunit TAF12